MCELLGIEQSVLERAFSYRTVEAKLEKVSTTLNVAQVGHTHIHTHARTALKDQAPLLPPHLLRWMSTLIHLTHPLAP